MQPEDARSSEEDLSEGVGTDDVRVALPRRAAPADAVRPTRAEINLGHLRHNLRVVQRVLASEVGVSEKPAEVWAVLKADAYGHGAPATARTLERAGADRICVALLEEAIELREAGIRIPIVTMGGYYGPQNRGLEELEHHDVVPVVYHLEQIDKLIQVARAKNKGPLRVHLKVDTGMARLGVRVSDVGPMLEAIAGAKEIELEGLMSHLACADGEDPQPTFEQLRAFQKVSRRVKELGLAPRYRHLANSAGALRFAESRFDAVRTGLALYGVSPHRHAVGDPAGELRPVMKVRSEIVALRTIADGEHVGYGHTFRARGPRTIATIPMGYADGLSRALSNRGEVLIRGKRAPIAGIVSMDLTSVDVTDLPRVEIADEVVLLGRQDGPFGSDTIGADEIAAHGGTISWEVLTHISRRVPRFYREP